MKISERAEEIYQAGQAVDFYGRKNNEVTLIYALALALDEWQESAERRLAEVRHAAGFDRVLGSPDPVQKS